jgi:hypothetical protein
MSGHVFSGVVKGGRFCPDAPVAWAVLPPSLEGKRVRVMLKRAHMSVTLEQHGYYRGTVLPMVAEWCGYDPRSREDLESVHIGLKRKFMDVQEVRGLEVVPSHADASLEEMSSYLDQVLRWAAEGGLYIPGPEGV